MNYNCLWILGILIAFAWVLFICGYLLLVYGVACLVLFMFIAVIVGCCLFAAIIVLVV